LVPAAGAVVGAGHGDARGGVGLRHKSGALPVEGVQLVAAFTRILFLIGIEEVAGEPESVPELCLEGAIQS
jgi:hypothetical protein